MALLSDLAQSVKENIPSSLKVLLPGGVHYNTNKDADQIKFPYLVISGTVQPQYQGREWIRTALADVEFIYVDKGNAEISTETYARIRDFLITLEGEQDGTAFSVSQWAGYEEQTEGGEEELTFMARWTVTMLITDNKIL